MRDPKIAPVLAGAMEAPDGPKDHRIIVRYARDISFASRPLAGISGPRHLDLVPSAALRASNEQIRTLSADPSVERIWADLPVHTCLDASVPHIQAPQVWAAGFTGRNVPIAILDTGIDPGHPDFAGRIVAMEDFTGEGARDNHGHGTHVAGIAGGSGSQYSGVAPEVNIYSGKVLHGDGSGFMSDVMAGLEWAVQRGARVINLSLGGAGPCDGSDALSTACDAAVDQGVMVCAAAGNYGPHPSSVGAPGCAAKVLTVGACSTHDAIATFSARGPTSDGRVKPDILMPGTSTVSCRAQGTSMGTPVDALYTQASGTSMATPHACGALALVLQAFPQLTPTELKQRIMRTAKNLGLDVNTQGTGRVNVFNAYLDGTSPPPPQPPPPAMPPGCIASLFGLFATDD